MRLRKFVRPFEKAFEKVQKENPISENEEWLVMLSNTTDEKILEYLKGRGIKYSTYADGRVVGPDDIVFVHVKKNASTIGFMKAGMDVAKIKDARCNTNK